MKTSGPLNQHKSMAMGQGVRGPTEKGKGPASSYKRGGQVTANKARSMMKKSAKTCNY